MKQFNIHFAKTHLSKLVDDAAEGESFVIAKAGKPLVKVIAIGVSESPRKQRFGFLEGQAVVPSQAAFDAMGASDIEKAFGGDE